MEEVIIANRRKISVNGRNLIVKSRVNSQRNRHNPESATNLSFLMSAEIIEIKINNVPPNIMYVLKWI